MEQGLKLAITGKGGVGKTTLASLLARVFAAEGNTVLAIDANPDANLGTALGIPQEELRRLTPIAEMKELAEERTGARPESITGFLKLNPRVDDLPDRFCVTRDGIKLLVMGIVKRGGGGCMCPESVLLKSLMQQLLVGRSEVVILDMDAGIEHLGRGTAGSVDAFIVVVEPGRRSLETARSIRGLASDLGIERCYAVGNKVAGEADRRFITENMPDFELLGFISFNPKIMVADLEGMSAFDLDPLAVEEARRIKERLQTIITK